MMSIRVNGRQSVCWIVATGFLVACTSTAPPSLPPGNPADPQVRVPAKVPNNLLVHDDTTVAIQKELSRTEGGAKSAETMHHDMTNIPGMKMEDHKEMRPRTNVDTEGQALADEMKRTSEEMKKTSKEMKRKSKQTSSPNFYYTCRMHPQIHPDKPGKCPICGLALIKRESAPPK
jgi:hypothetical protein